VHSNRSFKTKPVLLLLYSHYGETICDLAQFALKFMMFLSKFWYCVAV